MFSNKAPHYSVNLLDHFVNEHLYLNHIGFERCQPNYQFFSYLDYYGVHFIKSGKGILNINGSHYDLGKYDSFLIPPHQIAIYKADSENPWEYYYFSFGGKLASKLVERSYFANNQSVHKLTDDSLATYIMDCYNQIKKVDTPDLFGLEALFKVMQLLSPPIRKDVDKFFQNNATSSSLLLNKAQEYIRCNYSKNIKVDDICHALNISRSQLFRIFKKHLNLDVENYLISVKLHNAKLLLRNTNYSTANIAYLVGYTNPSSFYRTFKTYEGMTPSEWRTINKKNLIKNDNDSIIESSINNK